MQLAIHGLNVVVAMTMFAGSTTSLHAAGPMFDPAIDTPGEPWYYAAQSTTVIAASCCC